MQRRPAKARSFALDQNRAGPWLRRAPGRRIGFAVTLDERGAGGAAARFDKDVCKVYENLEITHLKRDAAGDEHPAVAPITGNDPDD
ncbi:hypothetical protein C7455_102171 [Roseicyclus mahoneyensis]|uniref:Uncharacterized protein n=1 Tax=Roseicyclus mahoneyensis TaxID=164332 RepID=A0A316GKX2_9RHOB|nr:hypothetical protein C7455_102171 [Roseicyclus mahoneyensis]